MKILQLGKFYPIRGGVEKVMYDLTLGLSERGVHCDMLCASTEGYRGGSIPLNKFSTLMVVPTQMRLAATMIAPEMIGRLRKVANEYDVIHIHHPDPMAALALYLSGYQGRVVLHWHSDIIKSKILLSLYAPLQSWLIRRADLIVGTTPVYVQQSPFLADVQDKVDYIPIGVNPMTPDLKRVREIKKQYAGKKLIFSLGRLVPYKGYEYLIHAAKYLGDDRVILIGGKGPMQEALAKLIEDLGLEEQVKLLGFLSDADIAAYYGACDLFCLSSIWKTEAFAIVQVEAMSFGKPVISTEIPDSGVSWVNADGQSGKVVKPEDSGALANAIFDLTASDDYRQKLSEGSLHRYKRFFTRDKMVERCLEAYIRVMRKDLKTNEKEIEKEAWIKKHG